MSRTGTKVLITGGAGFIGSHVCQRLLEQGRRVAVMDDLSSGQKDNLDLNDASLAFHPLDIRDEQAFAISKGCDSVVHLAGIAPLPDCQARPGHAIAVNTAGTANILEAARRAGVRRFLMGSTSALYEQTEASVLGEDDPVNPDLTYALSKKYCEDLCRAYARNYGMDIVIVRFFNVYGPHQDALRKSPPFTSYLARELVQGRRPLLFNASDARRDYLHVNDLVTLLLRMIDAPEPMHAEIFNAASGNAYSVPELYRIMLKVSGQQSEPTYRDADAFWDRYPELFAGPFPLARSRIRKEVFKSAVADNRKAMRVFGWAPETDIVTGMKSVYEFALRHKDRLQ